jgi:hypothetical protein
MEDEEEEFEDCDDETCPDCGGELTPPHRTTVRELISMFMCDVFDLDSEVVISLQSADNTISLELLSVIDMEDIEDPTVLLIAGLPNAWKTETGDDCGAGVLLLQGPIFDGEEEEAAGG